MLCEKEQAWAKALLAKTMEKELAVIKRSGEKIPYTTENGRFDDKSEAMLDWWTNGFWYGILWLVYLETKNNSIRDLAQKLEPKLDEVLHNSDRTHHDVGFMWHISSGANYRITQNQESRARNLIAANYLASRFNIDAGFITAWNSKEKEGWSIIDTMMNLPLLYWASEETGYGRFAKIAQAHADKTMEHMIRPDGSVVHIIEYDLTTGEPLQTFGGQGYAVGSSWTRGQAWGLYGFTLSYLHTKEARYLDAAKRIAHYFLAAVADYDYVPPVDFRSPRDPVCYDTTAGAIAACGLIEIAKILGESSFEASMYLNGALKLLKAMEKDHLDLTLDSDALLHNGSEAYPPRNVNMDIIYGDYYYIEALCKLNGNDFCMW